MKKLMILATVLMFAACGSNPTNVEPAKADSTKVDTAKKVVAPACCDTLKK